MSAIAVDISEFTGSIKELIASLKRDEEIVITADNQPVARLTSLVDPQNGHAHAVPKRRRAGTAKGSFWMSPDFNEPLDEFKEYME